MPMILSGKEIEGEYENYDSGKYQRNKGIQTSQLWREFQK